MRVPARSPRQAHRRYLRFLQQSLSCVSPAVWVTGPRPSGQEGELALTTSDDPIALRREANPLFLSAGQHFRIVPDERFDGEWKVRTEGYAYRAALSDETGDFILAWHWHPDTRPDPHLHIGAAHPDVSDLPKLHVPTGRVSFEEVVRFLVTELGVSPMRNDWEETLAETEARFRAFRTWPRPGGENR